jgi:hypothetical protein
MDETKPTFFKEFDEVKTLLNNLKTTKSEVEMKEIAISFRKIVNFKMLKRLVGCLSRTM